MTKLTMGKIDIFEIQTPNLTKTSDATDYFRSRIVLGLSIISIFFSSIIYIIMFPSFNSYTLSHSLIFSLFIISPIGSIIVLKLNGQLPVASVILLMGPTIGLAAFALTENVPVSGTFFWFSGLGLFGLFIFGLRFGKYWCLFVFALQCFLLYYLADSSLEHPKGMASQDFINLFIGDVIGITLGIWCVGALYEWQKNRTDQKLQAMQSEVLLHREKSFHTARLTELGQIAGGVAHEINNPLAVISGYTNNLMKLLQRKNVLSEREKSMLVSIERSCDRISKISSALLSYAQGSSYEKAVEFSLAQLKSEALELCFEKIKYRNIEFTTFEKGPAGPLWGKYVKILQIVVNLLNNAIDAVTESEIKKVDLKLICRDDQLEIIVSDSGPGVPPEIRNLIKTPFFTTKPVGQGSGLGLSIVEGLVRDLDGSLDLDNSEITRFVAKVKLSQSD